MDSSDDLLNAHAFRNTSPSNVDQAHDIAAFCSRRTHNCSLSAAVDESFHGMTVDFAVDVEHDDGAESLWVVFDCSFHVGFDVLAANLFGNQLLCLRVEGIGSKKLPLLLFCLLFLGKLTTKYGCELFLRESEVE